MIHMLPGMRQYAVYVLMCVLMFSGVSASERGLKVGLLENDFFSSSHHGDPEGLYIDVVDVVAKKMNMKSTIELYSNISDIEAGISNGTLDVGLSDVPNAHLSNKALTYTSPVFSTNLSVITKVDITSIIGSLWKNLYQSGFYVQFIIFLLIVLGFAIVFFISEHVKNPEIKRHSYLGKLAVCLYWSFGLTTTVGSEVQPSSPSGRAITAVYCFCTILILAQMSGTFSSMLTMQQLADPAVMASKNLKHLNVAIIKNAGVGDYFLSIDKTPIVLDSLEESRSFLSKSPRNAVVMSDIDSKIFIDGSFDLMLREHRLNASVGYYSFMIAKDSVIKEQLDDVIKDMTISVPYIKMLHKHMEHAH